MKVKKVFMILMCCKSIVSVYAYVALCVHGYIVFVLAYSHAYGLLCLYVSC